MSCSFAPIQHLHDNLHVGPPFNSLKACFLCVIRRGFIKIGQSTWLIFASIINLGSSVSLTLMGFSLCLSQANSSRATLCHEIWNLLQYFLSSDGPLESTGNVGRWALDGVKLETSTIQNLFMWPATCVLSKHIQVPSHLALEVD